MEITEVRIKLVDDGGERLRAFCSVTFDNCFVVRDLKIIDGTNGPFVAMPSRKLTSHCPACGYKNHLRANYCNQCGRRLEGDLAERGHDGRAKLYADIAHPINSSCREMIQGRVIREFTLELERSKLPGYVSRYDDFDQEDFEDFSYDEPSSSAGQPRQRQDRPHGHAPTGSQGPHGGQGTRKKEPQGGAGREDDSFGAGIF